MLAKKRQTSTTEKRDPPVFYDSLQGGVFREEKKTWKIYFFYIIQKK